MFIPLVAFTLLKCISTSAFPTDEDGRLLTVGDFDNYNFNPFFSTLHFEDLEEPGGKDSSILDGTVPTSATADKKSVLGPSIPSKEEIALPSSSITVSDVILPERTPILDLASGVGDDLCEDISRPIALQHPSRELNKATVGISNISPAIPNKSREPVKIMNDIGRVHAAPYTVWLKDSSGAEIHVLQQSKSEVDATKTEALGDVVISAEEITPGDVFEMIHPKNQFGSMFEVKSKHGGTMRTSIVSGMAWVTMEFENLKPRLSTQSGQPLQFETVPQVTGPGGNVETSRFVTVDANGNKKTWIRSHWVENSRTILQVARIPDYFTNSDIERMFGNCIGTYVTGMLLAGESSASETTFSLTFEKVGYGPVLFYFAEDLPYQPKGVNVQNAADVDLFSNELGQMRAYAAYTEITFEVQKRGTDQNAFPSIGFLAYKEGDDSDDNLKVIYSKINKTINQADFLNFADGWTSENVESVHSLTVGAQTCLVLQEVIQDKVLAKVCLEKLKNAYEKLQQNLDYVYDPMIRGYIRPLLKYEELERSKQYTFSHLIYSASVIAFLERSDSWIAKRRNFVNSLIRDVANPSDNDLYFPQNRYFDMFSRNPVLKEDVNLSRDFNDINIFAPWIEKGGSRNLSTPVWFAYAAKLWAFTTSDRCLEAHSNLQLALLKH